MKHNLKITIILLVMFLLTQLIGLAVINAYSVQKLPYGLQPPEEMRARFIPWHIVIAFIIALTLVFLLMRIKATFFIRLWFFFVVVIALAITLNPVILKLNLSTYLALAIALPLAFYKIFKPNLLVHNLTELLIYPGIAAVFVPILSVWAIVLLLLLISVYDIYAVWHSKFMQKIAKFQIQQLRIFAGFFIPYASKKTKMRIKKLRQQYKDKKISAKALKKEKIKVSLAILGGGDVVFPIIMAGVMFRTLGFLPALSISVFATLGLLSLFITAKKGKFYPAMPFITVGCLAGLLVGYLISFV